MRRNKKRAVSLIACLALTVQAGAVTAYANEAAAPVESATPPLELASLTCGTRRLSTDAARKVAQ